MLMCCHRTYLFAEIRRGERRCLLEIQKPVWGANWRAVKPARATTYVNPDRYHYVLLILALGEKWTLLVSNRRTMVNLTRFPSYQNSLKKILNYYSNKHMKPYLKSRSLFEEPIGQFNKICTFLKMALVSYSYFEIMYCSTFLWQYIFS